MPDSRRLISHNAVFSADSPADRPVSPASDASLGQLLTLASSEAASVMLVTLGRIATALERIARTPDAFPNHRPGVTSVNVGGVSDSDENPPSPVRASIEDGTKEIVAGRLTTLEEGVAEIQRLLKEMRPTEKERTSFSVTEVAEATGFSAWTIRQACNTGRLEADKSPDGKWRVSRETLLKIQNEGLNQTVPRRTDSPSPPGSGPDTDGDTAPASLRSDDRATHQ